MGVFFQNFVHSKRVQVTFYFLLVWDTFYIASDMGSLAPLAESLQLSTAKDVNENSAPEATQTGNSIDFYPSYQFSWEIIAITFSFWEKAWIQMTFFLISSVIITKWIDVFDLSFKIINKYHSAIHWSLLLKSVENFALI